MSQMDSVHGKAVKLPVEIDWFKWKDDFDELRKWVSAIGTDEDYEDHFVEMDIILLVKTLEGHSYNVPYGYIIIRGVDGEYYPCDPLIFNKTYKIV